MSTELEAQLLRYEAERNHYRARVVELEAKVAELEGDYQRICRGHDQLHNERDEARDRVAKLEALVSQCPRCRPLGAVLNAPANAKEQD